MFITILIIVIVAIVAIGAFVVSNMNNLDLHCWIERKDGSIYDPTPIANEKIIFKYRNINNKTRYYEEYEGYQFMIAYINVLGMIISNENVYKERGISMRTLVKKNKYSLPSLCYLNAYYWLQDHKAKGKMKIGKMGWKTIEGNMWWEFG